jgi:hypothetical protein
MISNLQSAQLDNDNPTMTIQFDCWSSQDSRRVSFLIELRVFFHWTYYMLDLVDFSSLIKMTGSQFPVEWSFRRRFWFQFWLLLVSDWRAIEPQPQLSSKRGNRLFCGLESSGNDTGSSFLFKCGCLRVELYSLLTTIGISSRPGRSPTLQDNQTRQQSANFAQQNHVDR